MKSTYCPNLKKIPLSLIFYALSDPVRLEIVQALLEQDEISCGACKSPLSKSTMSHHFKVLRESGLIVKRGEGKVHYLSLRRVEIEARFPGLLIILGKLKGPL
ncbi:MAG: helix-turn-helix transcriptional regulator [Bdellovibrionia bacterium]